MQIWSDALAVLLTAWAAVAHAVARQPLCCSAACKASMQSYEPPKGTPIKRILVVFSIF